MRRVTLLTASAWLACGVYACGVANADFRGRYPGLCEDPSWRWHNLGDAAVLSLGGPFSAATATFMSGFLFYGWTMSAGPCGEQR